MNEFIKAYCEDIEQEFIENVLPLEYFSRGILASEGFCFCAFSKFFEVDLILESGVYNGLSTTIWSKFFRNIPIIAIDKNLREDAIQRFKLVGNVQLKEGDSENLLPILIKENSEKRIAIFIDGPKKLSAIILASKCLEFENVVLVGIHDLCKKSNGLISKTREFLDKSKLIDFYTDDLEFIKRYSFMDSTENFIGNGDEELYWQPGGNVSKLCGRVPSFEGHGPTIGFILRK